MRKHTPLADPTGRASGFCYKERKWMKCCATIQMKRTDKQTRILKWRKICSKTQIYFSKLWKIEKPDVNRFAPTCSCIGSSCRSDWNHLKGPTRFSFFFSIRTQTYNLHGTHVPKAYTVCSHTPPDQNHTPAQHWKGKLRAKRRMSNDLGKWRGQKKWPWPEVS